MSVECEDPHQCRLTHQSINSLPFHVARQTENLECMNKSKNSHRCLCMVCRFNNFLTTSYEWCCGKERMGIRNLMTPLEPKFSL